MTTRILRWTLLLLSGGLLVVALSPALQRALNRRGLIPDQYTYGDLYNLTNLPAFKEINFIANATLTEADKPAKHYADVDLYTIGDSFTNIDTSFYAGNRNAHIWVGGDKPVVVTLDTTKKNILVLQFIERVLQERMYWPDYQRMYIDAGFAPKTTPGGTEKSIGESRRPTPGVATDKPDAPWWLRVRFGEEINQRIEFLLFNGQFFTRFKEAKAQLMLNLFGRVTGGVLSKDRKHVFYQSEVDTAYVLSAFRHIPDPKLDTLVDNLNTMRQHYRRMGFDEVYLVLIPNKVTVLAPDLGTYNRQIERIEANPRLQLPFISTIDTLRQHPDWYHLGDGHWNTQGERFWLRQVNGLTGRLSDER